MVHAHCVRRVGILGGKLGGFLGRELAGEAGGLILGLLFCMAPALIARAFHSKAIPGLVSGLKARREEIVEPER